LISDRLVIEPPFIEIRIAAQKNQQIRLRASALKITLLFFLCKHGFPTALF
jgi:hypothetical protein